MGLDMYAYKTRQEVPQVDFEEPADAKQIGYWWKHPNLHGWMRQLYFHRGGQDTDFNCSCLQLDAGDLDVLEATIKADKLPETQGFFFGQSQPEYKARDLAFIAKARKALAQGFNLYYRAWW